METETIIFWIVLLNLFIIIFIILIRLIGYFWNNKTKFNYLTFKKDKNKFILREICEALEFLSNKKIGVSLIFEKQKKIDPFIVTEGIKIDSLISSQLIITIFSHKKTQLHDGVMIIDSNFRIKSVSNYLPINKTRNLSSKYGARHRAVFTLISMIKVVGIVVSETDGFINCFYKKKIDLRTKNKEEVLKWLINKI